MGGRGGNGRSSAAQGTTASGTSEEKVRDAYHELAGRPGEWVPLADLREKLGQSLSRKETDSALESLAVKPGVQLIPWDNKKALRERDHDAALRFGGDNNNALRIET